MNFRDAKWLKAEIARKGSRIAALLFAETQPRLGTHLALGRAIMDHGYLPIIVCGQAPTLTDSERVGYEDLPLALLTREDIRALRGIDVFFSSEVTNDVAPQGAATVGIVHSIPDAGLSAAGVSVNYKGFVQRVPTIIRSLDYLAVAVRQKPKHWTAENYSFVGGVYPPAFLGDRRPKLDIVPAGYPKIEYSERVLGGRQGRLGVVIYSPTFSGAAAARLKPDPAKILAALLQHLPDYRIAFRPYPTSQDVEFGRGLVSELRHDGRLVLDLTATGADFQREAAVCVTDSSSSAITFSISTRRPLVFVRLDDSGKGEPHEIPFGFKATSLAGLVKAVRLGCEAHPDLCERISDDRDTALYNVSTAADYLARSLPLFADRKSNPEWLSIERRPWLGADDPDERVRHISYLRLWAEKWGKMAVAMQTEIEAYLAHR